MHSIRLFEKNHSLNLTTKIIDRIEQQIKIIVEGKPNMIDAIGLVFAETIFHPQGGGQPADKGTIDGFSVLTVREDKTKLSSQGLPTIFHYLDAKTITFEQFKIDQQIKVSVDKSYRNQCMRSHSAGHLIADALEFNPEFSKYQAKATHGNHFPNSEYIKVLLEVEPENSDDFRQLLNRFLAQLIQENLPVTVSSQDNELRHIKIGNSARMCGGTHVESSKDINTCNVTKIRSTKNKEGQIEATVFYTAN